MNKIWIAAFLALSTACATPALRHDSDPDGFRVAAAQYLIAGDMSLPLFLKKFEDLTVQAVQGGARLVVFPELLTLDAWPLKKGQTEKEITHRIATEFTPALFKRAQELSSKHQIAILAGSMPRISGKKTYNTAALFFPDGKQITQDKIFLTPWEKSMDWESGISIQVFDAPWGRTAILICFDAEIPLVSHLLAKHRPEVLLIPSMTESNAGLQRVRWTAQARAVEHHAYVVISSTVGKPAADWVHHGQAVFLSPWEGKFNGVLAEGTKNSPELVFSMLHLKELRESRTKSGYYPAKEQEGRSVTIR